MSAIDDVYIALLKTVGRSEWIYVISRYVLHE